MVSFLTNICEVPDILKVILFIEELLKVVCFIVPMLLIVMVTIDFVKCVIASDAEMMKKTAMLSLKRVLMAMALFLVPPIVKGTMTLLGNLNLQYLNCIQNATLERISGLEADLAESSAKSNASNSNDNSSAENNISNGTNSSNNSSSNGTNNSSGSSVKNNNSTTGNQSLATKKGAKATKGKCNKKGDYPSGNVKLVSTGKKNSANFLIKQMPGNSKAINIVNYGLRYVGYPYVLWGKGDLLKDESDYKKIENRAAKWGETVDNYGIKKLIGKDDIRAFDCSGFVIYVYQQFGYFQEKKYQNLSSSAVTTVGLFKAGRLIGTGNSALKKAKIGDLVLFGSPDSGHVAIYMGNNTLLHQTAGHPICGTRGVTITTTNIGRTVSQVRRIII